MQYHHANYYQNLVLQYQDPYKKHRYQYLKMGFSIIIVYYVYMAIISVSV